MTTHTHPLNIYTHIHLLSDTKKITDNTPLTDICSCFTVFTTQLNMQHYTAEYSVCVWLCVSVFVCVYLCSSDLHCTVRAQTLSLQSLLPLHLGLLCPSVPHQHLQNTQEINTKSELKFVHSFDKGIIGKLCIFLSCVNVRVTLVAVLVV